MEFVSLPGQKFPQDRAGGNRGQKVASPASPDPAGRIKANFRFVQGLIHKLIKGQGTLPVDQRHQKVGEGGIQGFIILFGGARGGEIDDSLSQLKFQIVKRFLPVLGLTSGLAFAQTAQENPPLNFSDLPSAENQPKLPGLGEPSPSPDLGDFQPSDNPSIPKLRAPDQGADKAKDQDWAARAMLQKKEEGKKRDAEQAALADQKAKESQQALEKQKKENEAKVDSSTQPAVSKSAVPGLEGGNDQKLPPVTGLEAVKPRAMASGDGRVQPSFNSFTGPSSTGPLGSDFQSGAKPIMPGTTTVDGRMQVLPQAPEPPSGAYKRISQDPNTLPPGYGQKKPVAPPPPQPVAVPPNPPTGDPKKAIDNTKAGFSPYDNSKLVPDPRSQRRF